MSMYKWLKWLNYVSAIGENEGHSADGSEILHRVFLENIPFFHPKKPRGTPKKSHSSSKVFSSKPISFSAAVSLRFIFFFADFWTMVGWWFSLVEVRLLVDGPAVDEDISHWRGLTHPKLAWGLLAGASLKKAYVQARNTTLCTPPGRFLKSHHLEKRKTICFQPWILGYFAFIYIIYQLSSVFFNDIEPLEKKKTNHPRWKSHRFFRRRW